MVESLRVAELRSLLSAMGKDKKGLKKDLVQRATELLHDNFHPELLSAIQELYDRRRSTGNSRRSWVIDMPTAVKVVADYPKKPSLPVHKPEVHMIKLPFCQTLETIVARKSLGTATALLTWYFHYVPFDGLFVLWLQACSVCHDDQLQHEDVNKVVFFMYSHNGALSQAIRIKVFTLVLWS